MSPLAIAIGRSTHPCKVHASGEEEEHPHHQKREAGGHDQGLFHSRNFIRFHVIRRYAGRLPVIWSAVAQAQRAVASDTRVSHRLESGCVRAFIGLGGNLGEPRQAFVSAVREMEGFGVVVRVSSLYETEPRDLLDQPIFTNAAMELETDLEPGELLNHLKRLEVALGREPMAERFSARTVDLDILAFDGRCVTDLEIDLIVPHPRLQERRFVLEPLAELDPGLRPWRNCSDLRTDVTVADLLPSVADQNVMRVGGPEWADR
jgi:2-amino-4-hydroxy-6-hydroxymethyldihydropteridine diphosphokinase